MTMINDDPTINVLRGAINHEDRVPPPNYLQVVYDETPEEKDLDDMHGSKRIHDRAVALAKPAACFLGPYNSGKSFLLNHILRNPILTSKIEPTTAVITVLRHSVDKPKSWPVDRNVFSLKKDVDLRTLEFENITASYDYDDLPRLTTYPEAISYQAILVFLENPVLENCTFYDCPGVGRMTESEHMELREGEEIRLKHKKKKEIREQELQTKAIENADAYIVLSSVTGGNGAFADANTGNILYDIARQMPRFPLTIPHGNLLLVGSQADPGKQGLENDSSVKSTLERAIQQQVENLPPNVRKKFDVFDLKQRVVMFFALDPREEELTKGRIASSLKRALPNATADQIARMVEQQFAADRIAMERTKGFEAALETQIQQLQLGMQEYRSQVSEEALRTSVSHFARKKDGYEAHLAHSRYYEALSDRYKKERSARENAWADLVKAFDGEVARANRNAMQEIERVISYWSSKDHVYNFLADEFGDNKENAKNLAAKAVGDRLRADIANAIEATMNLPQSVATSRLVAFDKKWLERRDPDEGKGPAGATAVPTAAGELQLPKVDSISVAQTFAAVTAGIAGGTTLLAAAGSALAQAAFAKALALGLAAAGTIGMGGAAAGLLAGIPFYGWIAAGLTGVGILIWRLLAWRDSLAGAISKSLEKQKTEILASARSTAGKLFDEIGKLGKLSLSQTKAILDGHISQIHEIGRGKVTSDDLQSALNFYERHLAILEGALKEISSGKWRHSFKA